LFLCVLCFSGPICGGKVPCLAFGGRQFLAAIFFLPLPVHLFTLFFKKSMGTMFFVFMRPFPSVFSLRPRLLALFCLSFRFWFICALPLSSVLACLGGNPPLPPIFSRGLFGYQLWSCLFPLGLPQAPCFAALLARCWPSFYGFFSCAVLCACR